MFLYQTVFAAAPKTDKKTPSHRKDVIYFDKKLPTSHHRLSANEITKFTNINQSEASTYYFLTFKVIRHDSFIKVVKEV